MKKMKDMKKKCQKQRDWQKKTQKTISDKTRQTCIGLLEELVEPSCNMTAEEEGAEEDVEEEETEAVAEVTAEGWLYGLRVKPSVLS